MDKEDKIMSNNYINNSFSNFIQKGLNIIRK